MMKAYFSDLVKGIEAKIEQAPSEATPRKIFALEVARLGERLYSGTTPVAWCGVTAPFDLLGAMGITSCFVEFVGGMLAATGMEGAFLEEAEQLGFGRDTCGYHRAVIGAAEKGLMPVPDFLVATSSPCTGGVATVENLARHFEKELFVLNVPQPDNPAGVAYLADQLRDLAAFVTAHTATPLAPDRLAQSIQLSNQACDLLDEAFQLAGHIPSPAQGNEMSNLGIVLALLFGTPAAVTVATAYRDAFRQRIAASAGNGGHERLRLMWIQNRIQFKQPITEWLADAHGAVIVCDELNNITWDAIDPQDPWAGMAERAIRLCINGTADHRTRLLQDMARRQKVHGAVNPCHWGCRQGTGARGLIADSMKQIGVPVLNLEVDCVDSRNFSEGQVKTRLEAFMEVLAAKPSPWQL